MSKLRTVIGLVFAVCALSPFAIADVQLRSSAIIACDECYGKWADFNGDGLDDFLVRNRIHLNLGGRLGAAMEIANVGRADAVTHAVDLNRDRFADLLVFLPGEDATHANGPTRLLLGDGSGQFTERPMPAGEGRIEQIEDFTGDGIPDLLRWHFLGQDLSILRGNGDATFTLHQKLPWPHDQVVDDLIPADVNGDGRLDIVTMWKEYLHIFFAQPDGQFGEVQTRFTRMHLRFPKFGDLNGDGKADLVFNDSHRGDAGVTALFGDGTGRFPAAARYEVARPAPTSDYEFAGATPIAIADFIAGGANEIAFGQQGDGYVSILSVLNDQLVEVARADLDSLHPIVRVVRFTESKPQLVAFGPSRGSGRWAWASWLITPEGTISPATAPAVRRRTRAIGRTNNFNGGRYHVALEGDCPLLSLRSWSLEREGLFIHVDPTGPIERAEAVWIDGEIFMRLHVKDGSSTRILEGSLVPTAMGLSGKLFEWKNSPCGGWQVHRVTATFSH